MESITKEFEDLKINLKELKEATDNFGSKVIGMGGFGKVYEGEVSHQKGRSIVAIKRLNRKLGQGDVEFLKEIMTLSQYTHTNLISLLGFCDEDGERILVYEHASNGSLDRHLSSTILTWTQRLKICLDAARGLAYLHDHNGTQQRVLHRDIKSANILLDENWNAKLSDMGLSKLGPTNQEYSFVFTNIAGTPGYCDPLYMKEYKLTKESDIYSFGVVLFEVLCGRLCFKYTNGELEVLVPIWKKSYNNKKLEEIIFKDLTPPLNPISLKTTSDIAFQCLHDTRKQRPIASFLVERLEIALKLQEPHDMKSTSVVGTSQKSIDDPRALLSKGNTESVIDLKELLFYPTETIDDLSPLLFGKKSFVNDLSTLLDKGIKKNGKDKQNEGIKSSGVRAFLAIKRAKPIVHFNGTKSFTTEDLFFGSAEVMGNSPSGTYYRVILKNGDQLAVNKVKETFSQDHREIEVRLNFLGEIKHPNLLTVRAYSKREQLLIYDYMPKGSLCALLRPQRPKHGVDWATRMRIAKGVARGLHSLHTHHNMFHGILTSRNIWLDQNINPKISDFGLSWLMTSGANSSMIARAWFLSYRSPYFSELKEVDTRSDIYSLGVIMLELLTRRSPRKTIQKGELPKWMAMLEKEDMRINKCFDSKLIKDASPVGRDELLNTLKLALQCVCLSPEERPDIKLVLQRLEEIKPEPNIGSGDEDGVGPSLG